MLELDQFPGVGGGDGWGGAGGTACHDSGHVYSLNFLLHFLHLAGILLLFKHPSQHSVMVTNTQRDNQVIKKKSSFELMISVVTVRNHQFCCTDDVGAWYGGESIVKLPTLITVAGK